MMEGSLYGAARPPPPAGGPFFNRVAMSAGVSAGGSTDFARIRLATAKDDVFAKIYYGAEKDVSDVAALACKEFTHWQLNAGQVRLHPVTVSGREPSEEEIGAALTTEPLPVSAAVAPGAWLVAVPSAGAQGALPCPLLTPWLSSPPYMTSHWMSANGMPCASVLPLKRTALPSVRARLILAAWSRCC